MTPNDAQPEKPKRKRPNVHRKNGKVTSHCVYFRDPDLYARLDDLALALDQSTSQIIEKLLKPVLTEVVAKAPKLRIFQIQAVIRL